MDTMRGHAAAKLAGPGRQTFILPEITMHFWTDVGISVPCDVVENIGLLRRQKHEVQRAPEARAYLYPEQNFSLFLFKA